jgi:hypothetical protein
MHFKPQKKVQFTFTAEKLDNTDAIGGIITIPAAIPLIKRIDENPSKYFGLSLMSLVASGALAGHGFGSIQFAGEEKRMTSTFIREYSQETGGPQIKEQKKFYLYQNRKSKVKLTIFSDFIITEGVIALASGLSQFAMENYQPGQNGIKPLRPTIIGGSLIALGTFSFVRGLGNQRSFENAMFTEGTSGSLSTQSWKKVVGISSVSLGTVTTGVSVWQLTKLFSSSFGEENHWYYDPGRAIPAFVSTFTGGIAMALYGFKAFGDYKVFHKGNAGSAQNADTVKEPLLSVGLTCNNDSYGLCCIYRF